MSFIISSKKIQMQFKKMKVIRNWLISRNIIDIMQFLRLINFYHRFIKNFNKIIMLLIEMLRRLQKLKKKMNKRKRNKSRSKNQSQCANDFLFSFAQETFMQLWNAFLTISILRHFNFFKSLRIEMNVSNKAIKVIFC